MECSGGNEKEEKEGEGIVLYFLFFGLSKTPSKGDGEGTLLGEGGDTKLIYASNFKKGQAY